MALRDHMEQLHVLFENATDAADQAAFMQAILLFTAAFLSGADDVDTIDKETTKYMKALASLVALQINDRRKLKTGRFDA